MLFGLISDTDQPQETIVLDVENGTPVVVPDAALLFKAEFHRDGPDLLLLNEHGADLRILGYFSQGAPAGLTTPEGAMLAPHVVERLAGPEAPGQYAQAGGAIAGNPIGQVETLEGVARVQRADGTAETLRVGMKVFQNDVVITEEGGTCSLTFADGTIFTLASGSRMLLDELIYDPNATEGNSGAFNLIEGSFVFIAGQVAKTGGMEVTTPAATMGIRGTTVLVDIQTVNGVTTVEVSLNVDPGGGIGSIELRDLDGNLIATIEDTDSAWIIEPPGGADPIEIERTVDDLASDEEILADAAAAFALAVQRVDAGETFVELVSSTSADEIDPETGTPFDTGAGDDLDEDDTGSPPPTGDGGTPPEETAPPPPEEEAPTPDTVPVPDDASLNATEDTRLAGTLTATDADGDALSFGLVTGAANGVVVVLQDGSFAYTPDPDFEGTDSFTFSVTDADGNVATGTVTLVVAGVNDAPVFEQGTLAATQDSPATLDLATLVSDPDAGDDPADFDYGLVTPGPAAEGGPFTLEGSVLTFTPGGGFDDLGAGETRTVTVEVSVTDPGGASTTGIVSVTVTGVNDAPVAGDDTGTTDEDTALDGALLGNDTDVEEDALSVTTVTTVEEGEPTDHPAGSPIALASGATLTVNTDGTYDYDPNGAFEHLGAGEEAQETFSYTISDGNGGTSTASVSITVTGVNDPLEVSTADFAPVPEGDTGVLSNVVFDLNDVLTASGADAGDWPAIDPDSVEVAVAPGSDSTQDAFLVQGSTLTVDTANYDGLAAGQSALFEVTFDVVSGDERITQSTTIEITGANDDPEANDDTPSTGEDTVLNGNVLGNDTDVDGSDVLTVTGFAVTVDEVVLELAPGESVTLDSGATLTVNADGTFGFDPSGAYDHLAPGETAVESFTYEMADGNGGTSEATVTITVNGLNDAPQIEDVTVEANAGDTLEGTLIASDVDNAEGDLTFSLVGTAGTATVVVNPDGSCSYTPTKGFIGIDTFEVEVSDGMTTSTATVTVEVGDDGSGTPGAEGLTLDIATEATPDAPAGNVDIGLSGAGVTPINIVFALDASGSIGSSNWNVLLQNVAAALDVLAEQFDGVEGADVQVSIIRFASDAVTVIEFTDLTYDPVTGQSNLHEAIEEIPYTAGGTNWADTFAEAEAQFLTQTDGGINYLYFVTDGNPTSSFQTELDSLTETIDGLSIYAFAIGSNVDEANLIAIDTVLEPGDDVRSAATTGAVQDTPLFNAALNEFSLSLTADGVDQGVVFSGVGGPLTQSQDGLSYDLPMVEIDGLEDVLGGQNDFVATAGFDIDGDGETDVTLVSTARIGKADLAQDIAGGDESDLLFGSDAGDVIAAGAGNDMVFGYAGDDDIDVGTGDETVDAGAGDDRVTVGETITGAEDAIDGGAGRDVLVFDFAGDLIDLGGGAHALNGIEAIDMANGHANTLTLDADFVQSLSDTPDSELEGLLGAALGDSLTVYGEAGDTVLLDSAGGFRVSTAHGPVTDAEGNTLVIYEMLDAGGEVLATLAVDEDVAVLPPAA